MTQHLSANIQGTALAFTDASLSGITDIERVKKAYKLGSTSGGGSKGGGGKKKGGRDAVNLNGVSGGDVIKAQSEGEDRGEMEIMILGMMALKGS